MKKLFVSFLFSVLAMICSFGQSFTDRGYLKLDGPSVWNNSYVIYNLTTSNEKRWKS